MYERVMGRWSRLLAQPFLSFAGLEAGEHVLDAGCGTGSLTFAALETADLASVEALDASDLYLDALRSKTHDGRITVRHGDIAALPFPDGTFDRALTSLVLQFVADPVAAVAELQRVTRLGGTVAAAVWDSGGGMAHQRMFWDTAAVLDPAAERARADQFARRTTREGELQEVFRSAGLAKIADTELTIRMRFADFTDYWEPIAAGEGSLGKYTTGLARAARDRFASGLRSAYLAGGADGPRSFTATAWACRGVVQARQ